METKEDSFLTLLPLPPGQKQRRIINSGHKQEELLNTPIRLGREASGQCPARSVSSTEGRSVEHFLDSTPLLQRKTHTHW